MKVTVQRRGGGLAIGIPKSFAKKLGVKEGDRVEVADARSFVVRCGWTRKYTLSKLLGR